MGNNTTKVEILFTARDGSGAGLKAVDQAVKKSTEVALAEAEKRKTKEREVQRDSTTTAQQSHDTHIRLYRDMANARERLGVRAERAVQDEIRSTQQAYQTLARSGALSARELARAQDATLGKVRELKRELGEVSKMQRLEQGAQAAAAAGAGGYAAARVVNAPIKAYESLDAAQADLKIALAKTGGAVDSKAYAEIMRQAVALGGDLPGATKDFVAAATALSEQGMPTSAITGGGLKASAQFGVLAKMDQHQSATTIAKMREAYGLGDGELPEMANLMQKARFAYGISPDDFQQVGRYASSTFDTLRLSGKKDARDLLAVQGMAASVGLESTSFGTNFAQMLTRTSQVDFRKLGSGPEAKEVRDVLDKYKIQLEFFGKDGKFAGIENMFAQLDKLKPLTDIDRLHVLNKLFGVEAGRPAAIMINKGGLEGFKATRAKLDEQSDMEPRIAIKTATLQAKEEALAGAWENAQATAAQGVGEAKKGAVSSAADLLSGTVQPVLEKHPGLGTGAITAAGLGTLGVVTGAASRMLYGAMGTGTGLSVLSSIPGIGGAAGLMARMPVLPKGVGPAAIGASVGGALLSSVYGEESAAARYGSAALSGAGLGATVGSILPGLGTAVGGGVGAALGVAVQGLTDMLKQEPKPTNVKADITVGLAPGLVLQGQNVQTSGPAGVAMNTGNIWSGAPK